MSPRRGAPTLGERARQRRINKGLTQADAGNLIDKSQAYVSQLEKDLRSREEQRQYLDALEKAPSQERTAGGRHKAGRAVRPSTENVSPESFRGEPLKSGFDYAATLPQDGRWSILGICRTAPDTELAFLKGEAPSGDTVYGLVGFHLIGVDVKRGRIIAVTEDRDDDLSLALEAFAAGTITTEEGEDATDEWFSSDDGLLAEDEG